MFSEAEPGSITSMRILIYLICVYVLIYGKEECKAFQSFLPSSDLV